jgi:hypothetical protein
MTTIPRNKFERKHSDFRLQELRRRNNPDCGIRTYTWVHADYNLGHIALDENGDMVYVYDMETQNSVSRPEVGLDCHKLRLTVEYPYGMKSCFYNPGTIASQFGLHLVYQEDLSTILDEELKGFMPFSAYQELFENHYNIGFSFSNGTRLVDSNEIKSSMRGYHLLEFSTESPWLVSSFKKRDSDVRHRAFWNRLEYKVEVLAQEYASKLQKLKKYLKTKKLDKEIDMIFDKNVHLREGYRASTYEPIKNMLSDDYLRILNIPPHNKTELEDYYPDRKALRSLKVLSPFKEFDNTFQESLGNFDSGLDEIEGSENREIGICWLTGHTGLCKKIRFYGKLVKVNKEFIDANSIPLTWLSCAESYVYTYDPRLAIGKLLITEQNKHKLDLELLPKSIGNKGIRSIQHGYLKEKNFEYCNGSDDWCDSPITLFNDEQGRKYSSIYASNHFAKADKPVINEDGRIVDFKSVWYDHSDPCMNRAQDIFAEDDEERLGNNKGGICSIPFGNRPELFYGYMRENNKGELEITKYAKPRERYYGVEIELERRNRSTDAFVMLSKVIPELKKIGFVSGTDGSLREGGTEFRSCPQTFSVLQKNLARFYEVVSPYFVAKETCGVHIHVSRSSLSNYQIGRIIGFVYNPNNGKFIRDIAGRPSGQWQEFESGSSFEGFNIPDSSSAIPRIKLNKRKLRKGKTKLVENRKKRLTDYEFRNDGKYTAVNTGLTNTIEFRLFAGSSTYDLTMKYLEFVDALCHYTETGRVDEPIRQLVRGSVFKKWLINNGKKYPNLCKFLKVKNNKSSDTGGFIFGKWKERKIKKGKIKCA